MTQEERSQRSRAQILDAALALFSHQGYRATSMREIADRAGVSTGSVYHQFKDKEAIFLTLLDVYWQAIEDPNFPINKALRTGSFPENLEDIGRAARESVAQYRPVRHAHLRGRSRVRGQPHPEVLLGDGRPFRTLHRGAPG